MKHPSTYTAGTLREFAFHLRALHNRGRANLHRDELFHLEELESLERAAGGDLFRYAEQRKTDDAEQRKVGQDVPKTAKRKTDPSPRPSLKRKLPEHRALSPAFGPVGSRSPVEEVLDTLDRVSHPDVMTKLEYKELLEELLGDLDGRLDAVKSELGEDA